MRDIEAINYFLAAYIPQVFKKLSRYCTSIPTLVGRWILGTRFCCNSHLLVFEGACFLDLGDILVYKLIIQFLTPIIEHIIHLLVKFG